MYRNFFETNRKLNVVFNRKENVIQSHLNYSSVVCTENGVT